MEGYQRRAPRRGKGHCRKPPWQGLWSESKYMQTTAFQRGARQPEHRPHIFNELNFFLPPSLPLPPPSIPLFFLPHSYLLTTSPPDSVLGTEDTHSQLSRNLQLVSHLPIKHALWEHSQGKAPNAGLPPQWAGAYSDAWRLGAREGLCSQSSREEVRWAHSVTQPVAGPVVRAAGLPPLPTCAAYKGDAWPYLGEFL